MGQSLTLTPLLWLPVTLRRVSLLHMKHVPKENTDDALIQEFLNKGGKVSVGKTKPQKPELGLSNNVWNNKLTKEEKAARDKTDANIGKKPD